ncbi:hypothetical protein [Bradyrhizobium tunisiense]|uniref:hypothetical protein n=1 Tax=Bradyrhizobium tunisiense TaxID=3278709 RepID=UPI0035E15BB1
MNRNHADYPRELLELIRIKFFADVYLSLPYSAGATVENGKVEKVAAPATNHLTRVVEAIRYEMNRSRSTAEAAISIHILDALHRHNGFYHLYGMADNKRSVGEMDDQFASCFM